MSLQNLNSIKDEQVKRITMGIPDLDWIYGSSRIITNGVASTQWGLPEGALSLWGGSAGVGKTRVCIEVCKRMAAQNHKILYFQLEITLSQFRQRVGTVPNNQSFFCSDERVLTKIIQEVERVQPKLIVVESVNRIKEYHNGAGTDQIEDAFRKTVSAFGAHVIFITHLNAEGDIKGGTNLPYMVDSVIAMTREPIFDYVKIKMSENKHRYGIGGRWMWMRHTDTGVVEMTENYRVDGKDTYIKGEGTITDIVNQSLKDSALSVEQEYIVIPNTSTKREWNWIFPCIKPKNNQSGNWLQRFLGKIPPEK
jgi:predicted ATP-dependent serine protease